MVPRTLGEDGSNEIDYYNWIGWGKAREHSEGIEFDGQNQLGLQLCCAFFLLRVLSRRQTQPN
jgi:hypothetical protein